jgi:hypothetical protein
MSNTAFNMNRNSNNTRDRHSSSGDRNPNPAFNGRRSNNSRDSDSREHNPFQRNNRAHNRPNDGGYQSWKQSSAPQPPKEKVLGPEDFPALPTATLSLKPKTAWSKPETTIADRMKDIAEKERLAKEMGRSLNEPEEEKIDVIPLSSWLHSKHIAKQREEHLRRMEMEEYEADYRWQMSKAMFPPKPEPEVPVYDENADIYDENQVDYEDITEAAPEYDERI